MKKHLTDACQLSASSRPKAWAAVEIFDLGYPGLALRIGHGGAKSFEHFYRVNGQAEARVHLDAGQQSV